MNQTHRQCWINWPRRNKCHAIGLQDGIHIGFPVIPQLLSYDTSVAKPTHGAFLKASMCGFFVEKMPFSSRSWRMISKNPIPISIYTVNGNVYIYIYILYPSLIPFSNDNKSYKIIDVKPRICSAIQGHQSTHLLLQVPFDVGWCDVTTGTLQISWTKETWLKSSSFHTKTPKKHSSPTITFASIWPKPRPES